MTRILLEMIVLVLFFLVLLAHCPQRIFGQEDVDDDKDLEDIDDDLQPRSEVKDNVTSRQSTKSKDRGAGVQPPSEKPFVQLAQGFSIRILEGNGLQYRIFGKLNERPILFGEIKALCERGPRISKYLTSVGPGWISIWVRLPIESSPSLLGIKVKIFDHEWDVPKDKSLENIEKWDKNKITRFIFDNVVYSGTQAMLWPVHRCPQWPDSRMFCMLFTDKLGYTEDFKTTLRPGPKSLNGWNTDSPPPIPPYFAKTNVNITIQTFRIPYTEPWTFYSHVKSFLVTHYNCNPLRDCPALTGKLPFDFGGGDGGGDGGDDEKDGDDDEKDDIPMDPMFPDEDPGGDHRKKPKRKPWPGETHLWVIFLTLILFVLAVILPIIYYCATRDGYRAADSMWTSWAEAPGNLIVGLGYTTVAWQGQQPAWKYEPQG